MDQVKLFRGTAQAHLQYVAVIGVIDGGGDALGEGLGHHGAVGLPAHVGQGAVQHLVQLRLLHLGRRQQFAPEQLCGRGPLCRIVVQQPGDDRFLQRNPGTPGTGAVEGAQGFS